MKLSRAMMIMFCLGAALIFSGASMAEEITTITDSLAATDPTQLGRLSRNGIAQDWIGTEHVPGVINPATTYNYKAYEITIPSNAPFVQISVDSLSAFTFVSVYADSYNPASLATNWLGDAGTSGNFFGIDPLFFQVIAPGSTLWIVVNNTSPGLGIGDPYSILVEGFADSEFTEPVPEPATMLLLGTGLVGLIAARRRKQAA